MSIPQTIKLYNLISMSQEHVDAWVRSYEENRLYTLMSEPEREVAKKNRKDRGYDPFLDCGRSFRGTFLTKEAAFEVAEQWAEGLHEGYYNHLLIESCNANEVDCSDREEYWFKLNDDWNEYSPIERPECFIGTCCHL
jgi:hypothetical protein